MQHVNFRKALANLLKQNNPVEKKPKKSFAFQLIVTQNYPQLLKTYLALTQYSFRWKYEHTFHPLFANELTYQLIVGFKY